MTAAEFTAALDALIADETLTVDELRAALVLLNNEFKATGRAADDMRTDGDEGIGSSAGTECPFCGEPECDSTCPSFA